MRIVVTGGSGLVGRRIVRRLAREHEVVNLDLRTPVEDNCTYIKGSILDGEFMRFVLDGADAVVHAAAIPGPSFGSPYEIERTNVRGTHTVARAARERGVERMVYISSEAVLGIVFSGGRTTALYFPIDELHPLMAVEPYGRSKALAETLLGSGDFEGMTVVSLRPPWVWVPEEYDSCRRLVLNPEEWVDGLWAYIHGDDLAVAVARAATRRLPPGLHAVYVAAPDNGTVYPTRELTDRYYPDVPFSSDTSLYGSLISSAAAEDLLGYRPSTSWRDFLTE